MSTETTLKSLIDTLDHKINQEHALAREHAAEHSARIESLMEARNEILNAHQAEINRANNGPSPLDSSRCITTGEM